MASYTRQFGVCVPTRESGALIKYSTKRFLGMTAGKPRTSGRFTCLQFSHRMDDILSVPLSSGDRRFLDALADMDVRDARREFGENASIAVEVDDRLGNGVFEKSYPSRRERALENVNRDISAFTKFRRGR